MEEAEGALANEAQLGRQTVGSGGSHEAMPDLLPVAGSYSDICQVVNSSSETQGKTEE